MNKDAQLIAEAYDQVLEGKFGTALRSLAAGAALAGAAHGQAVENPHEKGATINREFQPPALKVDTTGLADRAYKAIIDGRIPWNDTKAIEDISTREDVVKQYVIDRITKQEEIPAILIKKFPVLIQTLKKAFQHQSAVGG
jgi:hypothetical protein